MSNLIRGGQVFFHSFRMATQVIKVITIQGLVVFIIMLLIYLLAFDGFLNIKEVFYYYLAKILLVFGLGENFVIDIVFTGKQSLGFIVNNGFYKYNALKFLFLLNKAFTISIYGFTVLSLLFFVFLVIKGRRLVIREHLRGARLCKASSLKRKIFYYNFFKRIKPYKISSIPYPAFTEMQHSLITGGSGTGKTMLLLSLIKQIKQRGDRALIYDRTGIFTKYFYDENKDVILNPLDNRSPSWSLFKEVEEVADFDSIAAALIPMENGASSDPFWSKAARTLFSEVCSTLYKNGEFSNQKLVETLLKKDLTSIADLIKDTPAQALIDERSPKTALSVMSVLSAYLRSLQYVEDGEEEFSIRKWIKGEEEKNIVFVTSRADKHETLKPLITAWLEIAINSLLSLEQSRNRLIWVIIDELPSLHYIPSLHTGLAESRQFGGAFVLSLQLMAQLRAIYGRDTAEATSGLCRTRIVFGTPDDDMAKWCSNSLGGSEIKEFKESVSYGSHQMRDGVSINQNEQNRLLVLSSEITLLKNLNAYLKFSGNFPITKIKVPLYRGKIRAERFISLKKRASLEEKDELSLENNKAETKKDDFDVI